jgi:hypothetical protein
MTRPKEYDHVVPLHLIPVTIAQRIRERGEKLYRISIVRTHLHHYTVKCKCRAKIAMKPIEDSTDLPLSQPEPLSGSSGAIPGPEQLPESFSQDQTDRIMSRAQEFIEDFSRRNPEPKLTSEHLGTVVMAIDQTNGSGNQGLESITGSSGKDPGQIIDSCPSSGMGLLSRQPGSEEIINNLTDRSVSQGSESGISLPVRNSGPVTIIGPCDRNRGPELLSGLPRTVVDND